MNSPAVVRVIQRPWTTPPRRGGVVPLPFPRPPSGNHRPFGLVGMAGVGMAGAATDISKQMVIAAPSIAGTAATTSATAAAAAGTTWLGMAPTLAVPVIGAAVMGVTIAITMLFNRKRPKQKVATTEIVDTAEPIMQDNLNAYMSGPRTASSQAQALANFDANWQWVVDNCGIPEMGDPGQWCINDRSRGGKWDWFAYYRDPIANDPNVVPDPPIDMGGALDFSKVGQEIGQIAQRSVGGIPIWAIAAGVLGVLLISDKQV